MADELIAQGVPFVFATGYSDAVIPERFRRMMRWEKPYDVAEIVRDVRAICAQRSKAAE